LSLAAVSWAAVAAGASRGLHEPCRGGSDCFSGAHGGFTGPRLSWVAAHIIAAAQSTTSCRVPRLLVRSSFPRLVQRQQGCDVARALPSAGHSPPAWAPHSACPSAYANNWFDGPPQARNDPLVQVSGRTRFADICALSCLKRHRLFFHLQHQHALLLQVLLAPSIASAARRAHSQYLGQSASRGSCISAHQPPAARPVRSTLLPVPPHRAQWPCARRAAESLCPITASVRVWAPTRDHYRLLIIRVRDMLRGPFRGHHRMKFVHRIVLFLRAVCVVDRCATRGLKGVAVGPIDVSTGQRIRKVWKFGDRREQCGVGVGAYGRLVPGH